MLAAMTPRRESVLRELEAPVTGLRIGVLQNYVSAADDSVRHAFEEALQVISGLTATVRAFSLPELPKAIDFVFDAENYRNHRERLRRSGNLYQPETRDALLQAANVTNAQYQEGLSRLRELRAGISRTFEDFDLLLSPSLRTEPLLLSRCKGPWDIDADALGLFNVYGLPAISIPCGFTPAGVPIGIQIGGPAGRDNAVLALAHRFQRATEWHTRHPTLA